MKALVMEEVGKPMVVKDFPEPKCPPDGAVVRGGQRYLPLRLARMAG